jgi:hypothetical protein
MLRFVRANNDFSDTLRNNPYRESSPASVTEEVSDAELFESGGEPS